MEIKDRIKMVMESSHASQKVFSQFTNIPEATLSGIFNGRNRPSLSIIESVHAAFPDVSVGWLITGEGEMRPSEGSASNAGVASAGGNQMTAASGSAAAQGAAQPTGAPSPSSQRNLFTPQAQQTQAPSVVKYIDKPIRKITEIRVFYDDNTWESFSPAR